jgi:hypothetical protein
MSIWISVASVIGTCVGAIVAIATYRQNRRNAHEQEFRRDDDTFRRARQRLKMDMSELQVLAQDSLREHLLVPNVPLLIKPGWIPDHPLELERVVLKWRKPAEGEEKSRRIFDPARYKTRRYWSRSQDLQDTYHEVIRRIEAPRRELFFDGSAFRLLEVVPPRMTPTPEIDPPRSTRPRPAVDTGFVLHFGPGRYFDALDTTDVLGYETALLTLISRGHRRTLRKIDPMKGSYRQWLGDPFDFTRRCAIPGICTLTIRRGNPSSTFILHERNPERVALAQGVTHVTPAGEFQPKDMSIRASVADLDIWSNMVREYSEEFLGIERAQGQPLDTREDDRLRRANAQLQDAYTTGEIIVRFLGVGLDPLTWKPEILTVAIFSETAFDKIFADIVHQNEEGRLVFADDRTRAGISFTEENVEYRTAGRMLTAGQACLRLAWLHHMELGLA